MDGKALVILAVALARPTAFVPAEALAILTAASAEVKAAAILAAALAVASAEAKILTIALVSLAAAAASAETEVQTIALVILAAAAASAKAEAEVQTFALVILVAASAETKALVILAAEAVTSAAVKALAILASASAAAGFAYIYRREIRKAVRRNPDVFLNFCGRDIQNGLADYLSIKLDAKFSAFKDDCEQIGPGLSRAIENSEVAICIISQNCGGSDRFLTTLSKIMRRRAEQGLLVLPIFYEVDVSDVRGQTGEFGQAFRELAERHAPEKVEEWKEALSSLARIMGWSSWDFANRRQALLVNKVVDKVSSELRTPWIERIPMFRNNRRARNCQVFLLSSPATTNNFTCHLHNDLVSEEMSVFSNDDQYLIGKDFAHEVRNAIFIVVISEDFASSRDCLNKLTQIVEFSKRNGQHILHFFYEVRPLQNPEVWDRIQNDMMRHDVLQETHQQWEYDLRWVRPSRELKSKNFRDWKQLMRRVCWEIRYMQRTPSRYWRRTNY